jgi:DNA-binding MarR family transcriptional regulator
MGFEPMTTKPDTQRDAARLRAGIRALVRRFGISERADVACCGMTVAQAATLETLRSEGAMRLGELGRRLGVTASTLTRNLSRLEEAGLVARAADAHDARAARVDLTPAGRKAAERLESMEQEFGRAILERIPVGKRAAVVNALSELLVAVRGATESCCPGAFDHLMKDFPRVSPAKGEVSDESSGCC